MGVLHIYTLKRVDNPQFVGFTNEFVASSRNITTMITLNSGKIYHPKNLPDTLCKCIGPYNGETWDLNGEAIPLDMFIVTNDFPKPHFIVIDSFTKNYLYPDHNYYLVYLITHSSWFDNLKIEKRHCTH